MFIIILKYLLLIINILSIVFMLVLIELINNYVAMLQTFCKDKKIIMQQIHYRRLPFSLIKSLMYEAFS